MSCTVDYKDETFFCNASFTERTIPKGAGFFWDPQRKIWYTQDASVAVRLREFATERAKNKIEKLVLVETPWPYPLPKLPRGLSLYPHQEVAIKFALSRNKSYLGLDPGLGKTIVAARIAEALKDQTPHGFIYICPPFLVKNTIEEFNKWAPRIRVSAYNEQESFGAELIVVPDSMLIKGETIENIKKFAAVNEKYSDLVLFVDEAHRFKNETAKRTIALFGKSSRLKNVEPIKGLVDLFPRQIYMSGTPMPNRPIELYPILSRITPDSIAFMNRFVYGCHYCAGYKNDFGWDFSGASNVEELARRVIAPTGKFMLRQKKALLNLPPKLEEIFVLDGETSKELRDKESKILSRYHKDDDFIKSILAASIGRTEEELHLMTYRRLLGKEKIKPAVEYIESILEETEENLIIFGYHQETIDGLEKALGDYQPLVITGDTPAGERQDIVKEFQTNKTKRVIIGNYLAMGVGFTLTKATRVVFVEFSWVPGDNDQASDRAHRIGQDEPVLVQYLVYPDSIDKVVIETLLRKRKSTQYI